MRPFAIALAAFAAAGSACADTEIALKYGCSASANAEHLVKGFQAKGVIESTSYSGMDSISYYAAKRGFTAFGFKLVAISAFQEGTNFFPRAPGTSPGNRFGLIVQGGQGALQSAAYKQGIKPSNPTLQKYPQVSIDWAEFEPLPPEADPRFKYAQITCEIGFGG